MVNGSNVNEGRDVIATKLLRNNKNSNNSGKTEPSSSLSSLPTSSSLKPNDVSHFIQHQLAGRFKKHLQKLKKNSKLNNINVKRLKQSLVDSYSTLLIEFVNNEGRSSKICSCRQDCPLIDEAYEARCLK